MEQYVIKGGNPLYGEVEIGGAKNAALPILAAAIMADETVTIENLPNVRDINVLLQAIEEIGARVERVNEHKVKINGSFIHDVKVDNEYIRKIRASYYLIGALLGKYGKTVKPFNEEVQKKAIEMTGEEPITCRFADTLEPELAKLEEEIKQWKQQDEDVLSYALFPQVATDFFKYREAQQKKIDPAMAKDGAYPV